MYTTTTTNSPVGTPVLAHLQEWTNYAQPTLRLLHLLHQNKKMQEILQPPIQMPFKQVPWLCPKLKSCIWRQTTISTNTIAMDHHAALIRVQIK